MTEPVRLEYKCPICDYCWDRPKKCCSTGTLDNKMECIPQLVIDPEWLVERVRRQEGNKFGADIFLTHTLHDILKPYLDAKKEEGC